MTANYDIAGLIKFKGYSSPAIDAAVQLAMTPMDHPYHNTKHIYNAVKQVLRMVEIEPRLTHAQKELLVIAACMHDLGHPGGRNSKPAEFEQQSLDLARPHLEPLGVDMNALTVMILCTDVGTYTPQLKEMYKAHFMGGDMPQLDPVLKSLASDRDLTLMSLMLHEADIADSAGIDYETTCQATTVVFEEFGEEPSAASIIGFIDYVCNNTMLTPAGIQLYNDNMKAIYAQAQADAAAGINPCKKKVESADSSASSQTPPPTLDV